MHTKKEKLLAFARLLDIQERLRKECPWDRKQTYESLRPNTIEEAFELADALINNDKKNICKELGDIIEHVIFYAILGQEDNDFDIADICNAQSDKLMFRHDFIDWTGWTINNPNMTISQNGQVIYKDEKNKNKKSLIKNNLQPTTEVEVESTWEQRKQQERDGNISVLSGVPSSLPSIIKAYRIQDKARNVGFDWEKREDVWTKVQEELEELKIEVDKNNNENATKEFGDFIFSLINAARLYNINPDNALEFTNKKFIQRFNYIEEQCKKQDKNIKDLTLSDMNKLWNEAKNIRKI